MFALALLACCSALAVIPFVPDGGLRELYDRTIGYQVVAPLAVQHLGPGRRSSGCTRSSRWRPWRSALAVAFVPRERGPRQMAALGAAVLIALQLAATHWFYLYVVWFLPFVLVACLGAYRMREEPPADAEPAREREAVLA